MYSSGLPILFPIAIINFVIIFWMDKTLLLRFYRLPKNHDETAIKYSLDMMKYAVLFHFIIGAFMYSNDRIISTSGSLDLVSEVINPLSGGP